MFVVVTLLLPKGIVGLVQQLRDGRARRVAVSASET